MKVKFTLHLLDDLITLKEIAGRDKDLVDLKMLKKLKEQREE